MNDKPLTITRFGEDLDSLIDSVADLLDRVHQGAKSYMNSSTVVSVSDQCRGDGGQFIGRSIEFDVKDIYVLGVVTQASLALTSHTDHGKTFLLERCMNATFGKQDEHWWRVEVSRGMAEDDFVDINLKTLSESTLKDAVSACEWLSFPALLLDEVNRSPAKLNNMLLHIVDGSGLHLRGQLSIPVGMSYRVGGEEKRYSFTATTANQMDNNGSYDGIFDQDNALVRRLILSLQLDDLQPTSRDIVQLLERRRPKLPQTTLQPVTESIIRIYESLPETLQYSSLATLFLHYLSGRGNCIQTRSGHLRLEIQARLCDTCHLQKSHPFCGKVGGLTPGLLLWVKELAAGITAIRAAKLLGMIKEDCMNKRHKELQEFLGDGRKKSGLYKSFRDEYLKKLVVTGEDVVAAFALVAPNHVYINTEWMAKQTHYENSQAYAFADIARKSYVGMCRILKAHEALFSELSTNGDLTAARQAEVQALVTTEDPAFLSIISALREKPLPLNLSKAVGSMSAA